MAVAAPAGARTRPGDYVFSENGVKFVSRS
jgi:hypothetical protein